MKAWGVLVALAAACATTSLPPASGTGFQLEDDERTLWRDAKEAEDQFEASGIIHPDAELEAYLNEVARRLEPAPVLAVIPFRVRVVRNPYLNAFTLPNGRIYVHTGMLARMENEAQLSILLAHEMTHATHRHAVRERRKLMNSAAFAVGLNSVLPGVGTLAGFSAVRGYSRELETEADEHGLRLAAQAGYDVREAPKLFALLKEQLVEENQKEPFFFGTHPALDERVQNYRRMIELDYARRPPGAAHAEAFLQRTRAVVHDNAVLDLRAGRFVAAERGARKYAALDPSAARGAFLIGEVSRQRSGEAGIEPALTEYRRAIALDPGYPEPYRAIGLLLYKRGERVVAREMFDKYLSLAPEASDRAYIEQYIGSAK
jgi:beta-barrel assembly-enhancing protease